MINSSSPYGHPDSFGRPGSEFNPRHSTVATEKISVEWKTFFLDLQENQRGRCFKITEDTNGRRNTIIVPVESAPDFLEALKRILAQSEALPGCATA